MIENCVALVSVVVCDISDHWIILCLERRIDTCSAVLFVSQCHSPHSVRYGLTYNMDESILGPNIKFFDAARNWGENHILPSVTASGRWANIPVCNPPTQLSDTKPQKKKHYLSACLWASAEYKTRGKTRGTDNDSETAARIAEWIEFHLLAGFDHFYVYDNSGAHTNTTNLASALAPFGDDVVTRIDWPFEVCNNNIPAHDSTGERSSQYAAENSCLTYVGYGLRVALVSSRLFFFYTPKGATDHLQNGWLPLILTNILYQWASTPV